MRWAMFLLLCFFSQQLIALPDDLHSALKQPRQIAWDNLEGGSEWLSGPHPKYSQGFHWTTLKRAESVSFKLSGQSAIRLMSKSPETAKSIRVAVSDGSGLFILLTPQRQPDGSWIYSNPLNVTGIALLENVRQDNIEQRLAIFSTREELSPAPNPYRELLELDLPMVSVSQHDKTGSETFHVLQQEEVTKLKLIGPMRLLLENRFQYAPNHHTTTADYRLTIGLEKDQPATNLLFSTLPEYRRLLKIDGKAIVSGRSEKTVIQVPDGEHELQLSSDANILLRLMRMAPDDFLFPELNKPEAWTNTLASQTDTSQADSSLAVRQAQFLSRDNRIRAGGLVAIKNLEALVEETRHNDLGSSIATLKNRHLFSRPLLPASPAKGLYSAYFNTPRMLGMNERRAAVIAEQHINAQLNSLKQGYFHPLLFRQDYVLPQRDADSSLRISIDNASLNTISELELSLDKHPPIKLIINTQHRARKEMQQLDIRKAALNQFTAKRSSAATYDGAFPKMPGRFTQVSTLQIPLPAGIKRLSLTPVAGPPAAVALHFQDVAQFRPREEELISLLGNLGTASAWQHFLNVLRNNGDEPVQAYLDEQQLNQRLQAVHSLGNALLPTKRWLDLQLKSFSQSLGDDILPTENLLSKTEYEKRLEAIDSANTSADQLLDLKRQVLIARHNQGSVRDQALISIADILKTQGEDFLSERLLRALIVNGNKRQKRLAVNRLADLYAENNDPTALLRLYAVNLLLEPGPVALSSLVNALTDNGKFEKAMLLGMLLEDKTPVRESLLLSSLNLGYWRVFDKLLSELTSEHIPLWQARKHQAKGDFELARQSYLKAGATGEQALKKLNKGLAIRRQLAAADDAQRQTAVKDWSSWQMVDSGTWQTNHEIISAHAGSRIIDNPALGLLSRYYLANEDNPLELSFVGPLKLRILARPLHPADANAGADAWLVTKNTGPGKTWVDRYFIGNNNPTPNLRLVNTSQRPGQLERHELDFGPGLHRIQVHGQAIPMLISTETFKPMLPSTVLPELTPETAAAAIRGAWVANQFEVNEIDAMLISKDGDVSSVLSPANDSVTNAASDNKANGFEVNWQGQAPLADPSTEALMHKLIWRLEQNGISQQLLAESDRLLQLYPQLKPLAMRFNRLATWQQVSDIEGGGGFYLAELENWQAQSPGMEIRSTLLPAVKPSERVLLPGKKLGLELYASQAETLPLKLRVASPLFLKQEKVDLRYLLDDGKWQYLTLSVDQPIAMNIQLDKGYHYLQIEILQAYPNHLVYIDIDHELFQKPRDRKYHIATQQQPLLTHVEGPALLRIEQRNNNTTRFSYQQVQPGWQSIQLRPSAGETQALFRVFRHEIATDTIIKPPQPAPLPAAAPLPRLQTTPGSISDDLLPLSESLTAESLPSGQEDGTWTLGVSQTRRQFAEDEELTGNEDDFLELSATYREHLAEESQWLRGTALYRLRDEGDTLGLTGNLWQQLDDWPLTLSLKLSSYMQDLDTGNEWSLTASGAISQLRKLDLKTYHVPRIEWFIRHLSYDNAGDAQSVDTDVYSAYKNDHRHGIRLSDTLVHKPWQDTEWRVRLGLNTNESLLSADNITLGLEWRQLLGQARINAFWRHRHGFNDGDRQSAIVTDRIGFETFWEWPHQRSQRPEAGLKVNYDIDSGDYTALLQFRWDFSNKRGYRDYRPGEIHFLNLRDKNW